MDFSTLKTLHVACVVLSYSLFFVRGVWMILDSPMLDRRWVRVVPHAVDTVLLASAIAMTVLIGQYPFAAGWLTAKVVALVVYIGLGMVALRRGRSRRQRIAAWVAAQGVFCYIAAVALAKNPVPW